MPQRFKVLVNGGQQQQLQNLYEANYERTKERANKFKKKFKLQLYDNMNHLLFNLLNMKKSRSQR